MTEPHPLKRLRLKHGHMSQATLAHLCYTTPPRVSNWERPTAKPPTLPFQAHIAAAFGMSLQELQRECNWPVTEPPAPTAR